MTDPAEDSKITEEPDNEKKSEQPEIRTDGGEVAAQNPGLGNSGIQDEPTLPPQPGAASIGARRDRGETRASQPEATQSIENQVAGLPDAVDSHFTPSELNRLRSIAASKNAKSAWVIKRLIEDPNK